MVIPIAQTYVGDISPEGEEGTWMGYFNAAFFTGFGFGPLLGGVLTDHLGMTVAFSTMGGLNLLAFLIAALFLPIFAGIYIGLSPTLIGVLLTANMLLTSLLQVYSGNITDRFNRRALVIVGSLTSLTYLALIPLGDNFWQLLTICALGGLGGAISMPSASTLTVEEGRKFGMGSTIAIFTMAMSIGMAIGPIIAGAIADFINISSVFYFSAAMGLIGTSLFIRFTK